MKTFENRGSVITGGTGGVGFAAASKFAARGAQVAIARRDQKTQDETARESGPGTLAVRADVTDLPSLGGLFGRVGDRIGSVI